MSTRRMLGLLMIVAVSLMGSRAPAQAAPARATTYVYELRALHSGKCLDVRNSSLVDQAIVQQFTCHGGDNQRWLLTETSDRSVIIRAAHSGKCLDVRGASLDDHALVQQFTCHGGANQRWWVYFGSTGTITIQSVNSEKCLDIRGASLDNGAVAQQFTCHGGSNQRFKGTLLG